MGRTKRKASSSLSFTVLRLAFNYSTRRWKSEWGWMDFGRGSNLSFTE